MKAGDEDVDPEVELVSGDEQWVGDVLLDDARFTAVDELLQLTEVAEDADAASPRLIHRFKDPQSAPSMSLPRRCSHRPTAPTLMSA